MISRARNDRSHEIYSGPENPRIPGGTMNVRARLLRRRGRALLGTGLLAGALATTTPALATASPECVAAVDMAIVTRVPVVDWAENLAYDRQGNLWVSRPVRSEVDRYDRAGNLTGVVAVQNPMAVREGPDGWMYVVSNPVPGALVGDSEVVRFDPAANDPRPQWFASGLLAPTGLPSMPRGISMSPISIRG